MTDTAPLKRKLETNLPAVAAGTDQSTVVGEAPYAGTVTDVTFTPTANITGATSTKRTLTLINKGADGNGTTAVAVLDFVTGTDAADFDELAFTLSVVEGATTVAKGDILAVVETHASTGTANPGGKVQVEITRS